MHQSTFKQTVTQLEQKLSRSSFCLGSSAFRFGLIPQGISDHLPIQAKVAPKTGSEFTMMSWNMLADQHLFNNFVNISGRDAIAAALLATPLEGGNVYVTSAQSNKFADLFSELAEYLMKQKKQEVIKIDTTSLSGFVSLKAQRSRLSRSRDPQKIAQKEKQVEKSRQAIVNLLLDENHKDLHDFRLAVRHSLELYYHVTDPKGALRWENRFHALKENRALLKSVVAKDIVCLQECTKPGDIEGLFKNAGKKMTVLTHTIDARTNDHCVLMFDKSRFSLLGKPVRTAFEGKKPCIYAILRDVSSGVAFVVGSIHHPGGVDKNLLNEMMANVDALREGVDENMAYFVSGDYNHPHAFFKEGGAITTAMSQAYPDLPTMAGSDYGHVNQAIDAVMTNVGQEEISVARMQEMMVAEPAPCPAFVVKFVSATPTKPTASPAFFNPVRLATVLPEAETLTASHARTAPVVTL